MSAEIRTSPKKARKASAKSRDFHDALAGILEEYERATVRQVFYRAVVAGAVEKTEQAYKRVADALVQMRLGGVIPFEKIADGHRTRRIASTWNDAKEFMEESAEVYRRDFWGSQEDGVELWCEKDALSGILQPIADEFGIPYVATRGFPSLTLVHESALAIVRSFKSWTTILYFGDHDASGHAIDDALAVDLGAQVSRIDGGLGLVKVGVERIALTPEQILQYGLPTRPGKASDSRHDGFRKRFGSADSVELDALPPDVLEEIARGVIAARIDPEAWRKEQRVEELERETLGAFIAKWPKRLMRGRR